IDQLHAISPHLPFFFFNPPPTTEIYTLSLHDALPISSGRPTAKIAASGLARLSSGRASVHLNASPTTSPPAAQIAPRSAARERSDRKSTRLNSSHVSISYAVFCLKKKKTQSNGHQRLS